MECQTDYYDLLNNLAVANYAMGFEAKAYNIFNHVVINCNPAIDIMGVAYMSKKNLELVVQGADAQDLGVVY